MAAARFAGLYPDQLFTSGQGACNLSYSKSEAAFFQEDEQRDVSLRGVGKSVIIDKFNDSVCRLSHRKNLRSVFFRFYRQPGRVTGWAKGQCRSGFFIFVGALQTAGRKTSRHA